MNIKQTTITILPDGRMSSADAAKYLGISHSRLNQWRCDGLGPPFVKIASRIFYYQKDLERYVSERIVKSTSQGRQLGA